MEQNIHIINNEIENLLSIAISTATVDNISKGDDEHHRCCYFLNLEFKGKLFEIVISTYDFGDKGNVDIDLFIDGTKYNTDEICIFLFKKIEPYIDNYISKKQIEHDNKDRLYNLKKQNELLAVLKE